MNIVNKLTLRQLLLNKKRTLVTIIGTIISAAMITAVATLGLSFMDVMQRQSIAIGGEWHARFEQINKKQFEGVEKDKRIKATVLSRDLGYAALPGSENMNKPYLYIKEYNHTGFHKFPIKLLEGRLPELPEELVISEAVKSNAKVDYKIGDTIELSIGQRYSKLSEEEGGISGVLEQNNALQWKNDSLAEYLETTLKKSYTIVGIIERPNWEYAWAPGYTALSYIDVNTIGSEETFDLSLIFKKVNNKVFENAEQIGQKNGVSVIGFNNDLLRYYGAIKDDAVKKMLFIFSGVVLVIIMIGSISLIYNAFAISVSERSRYLGMLSSVGATRRQKKNSVFFEGAVIGAISVPIGIAAGYLGLAITYICINPIIEGVLNVKEGFKIHVYPSSLIISILVSAATILISTYIPARKASRISAIDAIRQVSDVKISRKQVHTSIITRKLFGIEGDLGLKNLKRNKGRYKATVFSLIISMLLFLVVSSFTQNLRKSFSLTQEGINFDIQTSIDAKDASKKKEITKKIVSLENISEFTKLTSFSTSTWINDNAIADFLKDGKESLLKDGKYPYTVTVNVLDDEALKKYVNKVGIDLGALKNTKKPSAIVIDTMNFKDQETDKYVESKVVNLNPGDQIKLNVQNNISNETKQLSPIKVEALTNIMPMGVMTLGKTAGFHIIISETVFQELINGKEDILSNELKTEIYLNSEKPLLLQEELEKIQEEVGNSNLYIFNVFQFKQNEQQGTILVSVFTYAFIILITSICIANIINTISTSIALRKREFAMLKSVGITPKGFNKMLNYESIFYGMKALIYGLPISILAMYLMHRTLMTKFDFKFTLPLTDIIIVIAAVFSIVGIAMLYSSKKVKKENIIDALKQEIV